MDKKTLIGLLLIGVILFGFTWYNNAQLEKYNRQKAIADSIAAANMPAPEEAIVIDSLQPAITPAQADTTAQQEAMTRLGAQLYAASEGEEQFYTVENDLMKVTFSNRGGRVASVELKDYKTYQGTPLVLFDENSSVFDLSFFIKQAFGTAQINTSDYYFTPVDPQNLTFGEGEQEKTFAMRLPIDSASYIEYCYGIQKDNYSVSFDVRFVGMQDKLAQNQGDLGLIWKQTTFQNEKGFDNENNYTTIAYNYPGEKSIEDLGYSKESKSETINTKVKWVAFKQQFFSSILVGNEDFQNGSIEYQTFAPSSDRMKAFQARLSVPFSPQTQEYGFSFYFGPNKFSTLKKYDLHFERLVPLGGWIVGWINRWLVIPTFDILGKFIHNYGIIILLLTIIIKVLISPLTYKSYLSTAKMRLLKPEMDQLNAKYPKPEDAMKKQQAMMTLYRNAGVNPMGGCLPLLIQLPILLAMFRFFPASIELRGEHFLWVDDLSSYDSILNLPFNIPFYGNHVSLFALLMAVSVYISSRINYSQTASAGPQMAGMKFMMLYMMPIMLLLFFNNYSSGLSYYYLVSNLITIGQTYAFRYGVSDEKLHQRMKENAKKPQKKSKWQERYEEALRQQQANARRR